MFRSIIFAEPVQPICPAQHMMPAQSATPTYPRQAIFRGIGLLSPPLGNPGELRAKCNSTIGYESSTPIVHYSGTIQNVRLESIHNRFSDANEGLKYPLCVINPDSANFAADSIANLSQDHKDSLLASLRIKLLEHQANQYKVHFLELNELGMLKRVMTSEQLHHTRTVNYSVAYSSNVPFVNNNIEISTSTS